MTSIQKLSVLKNHPPPRDRIDQLLSTAGDGTGTTQQAANFAAAPTEFIYRPSQGVVAIIMRVLIGIEDGSAFAADLYGGVTALSNGIKVYVKDKSGGVIHDFTPNPITKTWHWGLLAGSDITPIAFAAGVDRALIRWTFDRAGQPLILNGDEREYLSVLIRDDLSGLVSQLMQVQGFLAK